MRRSEVKPVGRSDNEYFTASIHSNSNLLVGQYIIAILLPYFQYNNKPTPCLKKVYHPTADNCNFRQVAPLCLINLMNFESTCVFRIKRRSVPRITEIGPGAWKM